MACISRTTPGRRTVASGEDRSQWIGEWHIHPTGALSLSEVDLRFYMCHLHDPELGIDKFVAIIAGFESSARVVVAIWLVERERILAVLRERLPTAPAVYSPHASDAVRHATFVKNIRRRHDIRFRRPAQQTLTSSRAATRMVLVLLRSSPGSSGALASLSGGTETICR